jgi:predicted nucleic acid-binding protein
MNVYIETNFILELAFAQEQQEYCQQVVALAEANKINLVIPAFSLAEPYETLVRRGKVRTQLHNDLGKELRQLSRSQPYQNEVQAFQSITGLLVRSIHEEDRRLIDTLEHLSKVAYIIPLNGAVIASITHQRTRHQPAPQDAIVYSSVLQHLEQSNGQPSCFINKNSEDFGGFEIIRELKSYNCKLFFDFLAGFNYIKHQSKPA